MVKSYTNRGKGWEWLQSWWMLFVLLPFGITSFIAFLYAGIRVKTKKWILYSFFYLGAFILAWKTPDSGTGALIAISAWVIAIVSVFRIRPVFLIQLDVLKETKSEKLTKIRQEAKSKFANKKEVQTTSSQVAAETFSPQPISKAESEIKQQPVPAIEQGKISSSRTG